MRDGSGWFVFPVFALNLLLATIRASSQVGSNLAPAPSPGSPQCFSDDRCTLQTFKEHLLYEGEPALASWNNLTDVSSWNGVTWLAATNDGSIYVETLDLSNLQLQGNGIYPLLQEGLPLLVSLNISRNNFTGTLPSILRICPALQVLDLSNNSFDGVLPLSMNCEGTSNNSSPSLDTAPSVDLLVFNLTYNKLTGQVPRSLLMSLLSVQNLSLSWNFLQDDLPSDGFGSLRNLVSIDLQHNSFTGSIPSSLGNCSELVELRLSSNNFTGQIPFDVLGNLPNLQVLDVGDNQLDGELVISTDGGSFAQLRILDLSQNNVAGTIPEPLGNLSNLETLTLKGNKFTGSIPSSLSYLARLRTLDLQKNNLNGTIPVGFSQLSSLSTLSLNDNKLSGTIAPQLANCTGLQGLWLYNNWLSGPIPPALGNLSGLLAVALYGNRFIGSLPAEVGNLRRLVALDCGYNSLSGEFPVSLCNLYELQFLSLDHNKFFGPLHGCIGNFSHLRILDMSSNNFSGSIPSDLGNLKALISKGFQDAPEELSTITYIQEVLGQKLTYGLSESPNSFFLEYNRLSGEIPQTFALLQNLQQLDLSYNTLSGPIPAALGNDSALLLLNLSNNNLSGSIPSALTDLSFLSNLDLSYNNLSGPIPKTSQFSTFSNKSFLGNPLLCGLPLNTSCSPSSPNVPHMARSDSRSNSLRKKLLPLYIILGSAFVCSVFLGGLFAWSWISGFWQRKCSLVSNDGHLFEDKDDLHFFQVTISCAIPSLSPKELAMATDYYNENNIVGDGGFGLVYKAVLNNGTMVAVKKQIEDGAQGQSEFLAEMKTLGKIKHRNLVCLLGYCAYGKERILVYEYMKNGSLDSWLHCREEGVSSLDWRTRLKVARGAAEGLAYLHHGLIPAIIHRDVKASNILLDCDFEARLADFGLARSTRAYESHVSTDFAGTAGYIPPEYSQATSATTKGDVYSFGVVLLEILTGRRPTDPFFGKKEMSHVVTWILDMSMEEAIEKTLDLSSSASTEEMLELMRIACECCHETPARRPTMGQVVKMLEILERQQSPSRSPSVIRCEEALSSPRCR